MEEAILNYTKYIYFGFIIVAIGIIIIIIVTIFYFLNKYTKSKKREEKILTEINNMNKIKCPSCEKDIDDDSNFCKYCNYKIKN